MGNETITDITLDERSVIRRATEIERERIIALHDLLATNTFAPAKLNCGPYRVHLSIAENRLQFDIRAEALPKPHKVLLPITPLRKVIKDYFLICESYFEAMKSVQPHRTEAIDMGRRGVHNEGAEQLQKLLDGKIEVDFNTARRLFTLICVLHIK